MRTDFDFVFFSVSSHQVIFLSFVVLRGVVDGRVEERPGKDTKGEARQVICGKGWGKTKEDGLTVAWAYKETGRTPFTCR